MVNFPFKNVNLQLDTFQYFLDKGTTIITENLCFVMGTSPVFDLDRKANDFKYNNGSLR